MSMTYLIKDISSEVDISCDEQRRFYRKSSVGYFVNIILMQQRVCKSFRQLLNVGIRRERMFIRHSSHISTKRFNEQPLKEMNMIHPIPKSLLLVSRALIGKDTVP